MRPLVIVGAGLAGYQLAKEFRKLDSTTPLRIYTADDGRFYSKPLLSNALAKGMTPERLATASAERMAEQLGAEIHTGRAVSAIETAAGCIRVGDETIEYGSLVLAVGAEQQRLSAAGDGEIFTVNGLADYARFRCAVDAARSVAIIGPGLIGCEFANDLCGAGKTVTVIGPDPHPLGRLLPPMAGAALQAALAAAGVSWRLNTSVTAVRRQGGGRLCVETGADRIEADVVLSAIGLRPNTRLAEDAGLQVGRGIAVDGLLRTSAPHVYALGDCAEMGGRVLPFVMPIMHGARALAATLTGAATELLYPPMPVVVKTPAHPVVIAPPPPGAAGAWEEEAAGDGVRSLFRDGQDLLGFALTGAAVADRQRLGAQLR